MSDEDLEDVLPIREKARRHLMTWGKKLLAEQLSMTAKDGWLGKWADEYDKANDGR